LKVSRHKMNIIDSLKQFHQDRLEYLDLLSDDISRNIDDDEGYNLLVSMDDRNNAMNRMLEVCTSTITVEQECTIADLTARLEQSMAECANSSECWAGKELEYLSALRDSKTSLAAMEKKYQQLNDALADSDHNLAVAEESINQYSEQNDKYEAEIERLGGYCAKISEEISKNESENKRILSDLNWQLEDLRSQLADADNKLSESIVERDRLDEKWRQRLDEERHRQKEASKMKAHEKPTTVDEDWCSPNNQLREKLELQYQIKLVESIGDLDNKYRQAMADESARICQTVTNEYQSVINELKTSKTIVESKLAEADAKIRQKMIECAKLTDKIEELEVDQSRLTTDTAYWKAEGERSKAEYDEQQIKYNKAYTDKEILNKELSQMQASLKDQQSSNSRLKSDYSRLEKLLTDRRQSHDIKDEELSTMQNKLEALNKQKDEYMRNKSELEGKLESMKIKQNTKVEELKAEIAENTKVYSQMK
jgi:chromosome segregation ATPase